MSKFSEEDVVIKNEFFDRHGSAFSSIGKHEWKGDKGKDSYWIHKYKDSLERAWKPYQEAQKELAEEVSVKDPETGEPVRTEGGYRPEASKMNEYDKRIKELSEIEVNLGIKKRFFDPKGKPFKGDGNLNPDEWAFIKPYIANWPEFEAEFEREE